MGVLVHRCALVNHGERNGGDGGGSWGIVGMWVVVQGGV